MFLVLTCLKSFAYICAWKIFTCYLLLLLCEIVVNFHVPYLIMFAYFFSNKEYEYNSNKLTLWDYSIIVAIESREWH